MDLSVVTQTYGADDQSWIGANHGIDLARSISLDMSVFTAGTHYPDGFVRAGTPLGRITATGLYGPYGGRTNEVQTINLGAATAGTVTIAVDGETTTALAFNATAAAVQTALEALSNVSTGDVTVTGGPLPGTITLSFAGRFAGTDVPTVTVTPTGLTGGTVTVTTTVAGGSVVSDGRQTLAGVLLTPVKPNAVLTVRIGGALFEHGRVVEPNLPIAVDAAGKADVAGRITFEEA